MTVPSDEYFVRHVESQWAICEDDHTEGHKAHVRELVKIIRNRALSKSHGQQIEFYLTNIFKAFDLNRNGLLGLDEMGAMLGMLGIRVEPNILNALMATIDTNNNGTIEFEEFLHFIAHDRYT